jgi:hypothetical protein
MSLAKYFLSCARDIGAHKCERRVGWNLLCHSWLKLAQAGDAFPCLTRMRARASTSDRLGGNCRTTHAACALRHFVEIHDILRNSRDQSLMKAAYPARCLFHLRAMQQLTRLPELATTEFSSAAATPPLVG